MRRPTRLAVRRFTLGMTQKELAERAGVHRKTVTDLEASDRMPNWKTANKLARALDCEPHDLFAERGEESDAA